MMMGLKNSVRGPVVGPRCSSLPLYHDITIKASGGGLMDWLSAPGSDA